MINSNNVIYRSFSNSNETSSPYNTSQEEVLEFKDYKPFNPSKFPGKSSIKINLNEKITQSCKKSINFNDIHFNIKQEAVEMIVFNKESKEYLFTKIANDVICFYN